MFGGRPVATFASESRDGMRGIELAGYGGGGAVTTETARDFFRRDNAPGRPIERTGFHQALIGSEIEPIQAAEVAEAQLTKFTFGFRDVALTDLANAECPGDRPGGSTGSVGGCEPEISAVIF